MSDPLSIASGVAGLIAITAKLVHIMSDFVKNTRDAPILARDVLTELVAMKTIFSALKSLVNEHTQAFDESRLSLICINDLRITMMGCIVIMDSLEREIVGIEGSPKLMKGLRKAGPALPEGQKGFYQMPVPQEGSSLMVRFQWSVKTTKFKGLLEDLQKHKLTLNLMLTTISSATSSEALRNSEQLKGTMERVIRSQTMTSKQLSFLIQRQGPPSEPMEFDNHSFRSTVSSALSMPLRSFEAVLKRTRVYRRDYMWSDSISLGSSVMKRTRWSKMSDLSLSEISNMAVIDLEIWPQDLWNAKYYSQTPAPVPANDDDEIQEIPIPVVPGKDQRELFQAIADGDVDAVKEMLEAGASLEAVDDSGKGLLHWAAQSGCIETMKLLLEKGAQVDAYSPEFGWTPIHCAVQLDDAEAAKLFLDHGANIDAKDRNGYTPLAFAASYDNFDCAKLLIERGADMNAYENKLHKRILHIAAETNSKRVAKLLLEKGASARTTDGFLKTPKMYAMIAGHKEMREILSVTKKIQATGA